MNFQWGLNIICILLFAVVNGCQKEPAYEDTLVYAHAGTSLYSERWIYPANTHESVLYGLDVLDAEGVEVDVQMTRDSMLVLYHDEYLDKNTRLSGCIPQYNYHELLDINLYNTPYQIPLLKDVMASCIARNKKIYLDLKPFHYCEGKDIDHGTFDRALNSVLEPYSSQVRSGIVVNSRNSDLLKAISDTSLVKSFETSDLTLGLQLFFMGEIHELSTRIDALSDSAVEALNQAGLKFCIFSVKTQAEIKTALKWSPYRIVTDNVAFTHKLTR